MKCLMKVGITVGGDCGRAVGGADVRMYCTSFVAVLQRSPTIFGPHSVLAMLQDVRRFSDIDAMRGRHVMMLCGMSLWDFTKCRCFDLGHVTVRCHHCALALVSTSRTRSSLIGDV